MRRKVIMNKYNIRIKISKNLKSILSICFLIVILGGIVYVSVYTQNAQSSQNIIRVNKEILPSLDDMKSVDLNMSETKTHHTLDEKNINIVDGKIQSDFGVSLLSSKLASENPYIIEKVETDYENYVELRFKNYIIGDTSGFQYNKREAFYTYKEGKTFFSPLSLQVYIILSEDQMNKGMNIDYMGDFKFEEQYVSKQGYKVNIIRSKKKDNLNRYAIFVADGIRYTLEGRIALENMKAVVDTMEYIK